MMKFILPIIVIPIIKSRVNWPLFLVTICVLTPATLSLLPLHSPHSLTPSLSVSHLSTILISLSLWLTALMLLASYPIYQQTQNPSLFLTLLTFLLAMLVLSFSTNSLIKFYIAFESTLIPTAALIMRWGYQPERIAASLYMLMYTLTASLPLLITLIMLFLSQGSLSTILEATATPLTSKLSLFMMLAFLVKLPMYTLHQWLPKAHVEAPVAGSMILAGVLLKLGAFGMFLVFHTNPQLLSLKHALIPLSLLGALTTALLCLRQSDMKALIAYASVSHMSLMLAAIMMQSSLAWQGSAIMLIAHGLTSSGLFAAVNTIYETFATRNLLLIKALLAYSPMMTLWWFFLIMSNMATPPFINLPAEMFIISSLSSTFMPALISILAALVIFTSSYSLSLFTSSSHGPPQMSINPILIAAPRTHLTAISHLAPMLIMILVIPILSI